MNDGRTMVQAGRRLVPIRPMALITPALLVALTLSKACLADGGVATAAASESPSVAPVATPVPGTPGAPASGATAAPEAPDAVGPKTRVPRVQSHHAPGRGIDETVRRLTRGLDLDTAQQAKLRSILWDEQKQARQLRAGAAAGVDWTAATAAILDQTKARIRAMLSDEQKKKYSVEVPRDNLGPAHADLDHYMQLQESRRQQDDGTSQ